MASDWAAQEAFSATPYAAVRQFFKVALDDFRRVGGIFPSTPYAARAVARQLWPTARTIVEYGPGDGAVTREILRRMPQNGHLLAVESNDDFARSLRRMTDPRLTVISGDAQSAVARLPEIATATIDAVVSGIPFSFLRPEARRDMVEATWRLLPDAGQFILYQTSRGMLPLMQRYFRSVRVHFEPRNLPPYFVIVGTKDAAWNNHLHGDAAKYSIVS